MCSQLPRPWYRLSVCTVLLFCLLVVGCGKKSEVSGTIKYKGEPVKMGSIQFKGSDGGTYSTNIKPDGTYTVLVPPGIAQVMIYAADDDAAVKAWKDASAAARENKEKPKGGATKSVQIKQLVPPKYADWSTSGLKCTVKAGKHTENFDLTD